MDPKTIIGSETFKYFVPAMGGMVTVTPFINIKYILQTTPSDKVKQELLGRVLKPYTLWKGLPVNMLLTPAIAFMGLSGNFMQRKWEAHQGAPLNPVQRIMNMVLAGSLVSLAQNPMDLMVINLNQPGMTLNKVIYQLNPHNFMRGYILTAARESGFGVGVYALVGEFKKYMDSNLLAGMSASAIVAPITQPIDTVKTEYQKDMKGETIKTIRQAFKKVCAEKRLMKGLLPRFTTITVFSATIAELTDQIKKLEQKL
jgi:DNA-binding transcriptional regulator YiaG